MAKQSPANIISMGVWHDNPVFRQLIGICSAQIGRASCRERV